MRILRDEEEVRDDLNARFYRLTSLSESESPMTSSDVKVNSDAAAVPFLIASAALATSAASPPLNPVDL